MTVPVITSITPAGGSIGGGTAIVITGTDLGTPTAVAFGATPAASFAGVSATQALAVSPAGTGTVHVTLTTAGGTSADAVDFSYESALFTVAEARTFDKGQLAESFDYPDATVAAKEAEIREWLTRACGVDFVTTTHTDEYHDGDGTADLMLDWPLVDSITAASVRSGTTWTALTSDELALLQVSDTGLLYRDGSSWPKGRRNVRVTYVAGHSSVPALITRAALRIAVMEMPAQNAPWTADGYEAGGTSYSFTRGDGYGGAWSSDPEVMKAIRLYDRRVPGIS